MGYAEVGLEPARADAALLRSVALARQAAASFPRNAASSSPHLSVPTARLSTMARSTTATTPAPSPISSQFHRERIEVLANAPPAESPDLLAFETLPSLAEAEAIGQALAPHPELAAWFAFTCRDRGARGSRRTSSPMRSSRCRLSADRRHRRQLHAPVADLPP